MESFSSAQEKSFVSQEILAAAFKVLESAPADDAVFHELGLGYDAANPMCITEDDSRLAVVVHQLTKNDKTYFLGYTKE